MSSNNNLSAKEREILERQKKLASKLKPGAFADNNNDIIPKPPPPPPSNRTQSTSRLIRPSSSKPPAKLIDLTKSQGSSKVIDLTKSSASTAKASATTATKSNTTTAKTTSTAAAAAAAPAQKRPTLKRKGISAATAARLKSDQPPAKRPNVTTAADAAVETTLKVERKEKKAAPSGSLAKLVQHVANENAGDTSGAALPTIQADDFWKFLRDWDFCSQYAQTVGPNSNNQKGSQSSRKPLPNIFLNVKQYIALWAPLCMAECKAQIMQEASLNMTAPLAVKVSAGTSQVRMNNRNGGVNSKAVTDFTNTFDEIETATYVQLQPERKGAGNDINFVTHDICLLLTSDNRDLLKLLRTGRAALPQGADPEDLDRVWDSAGMIGHTEVTRQGVSGLTLKVSKRKWAKLGTNNSHNKIMYLVKLGSNVTALREFTALCRIDMLPLQKFLLGQHLEKGKPRKLSRNQSTEQLLNQMGGKAALGEGFLKYAQNKFNSSQLTAIAASAHEYGDGGFTLIKGPPGTGSTYPRSSNSTISF